MRRIREETEDKCKSYTNTDVKNNFIGSDENKYKAINEQIQIILNV